MNTLQDVAAAFPRLFVPNWTTDLTCGHGWVYLAADACHQLDALRRGTSARLALHHISRNFGGLRLWAEPATPEVRTIVEWSERLSRYLCECCAQPGTFREHRPGIWLTLCPSCAPGEPGLVEGQP